MDYTDILLQIWIDGICYNAFRNSNILHRHNTDTCLLPEHCIKSNIFPHSTTSHQVKEEYIYQTLNAISYSDETCSSLCYMHIPSTPNCHFFIQYGGTCMLGNFNISGTYSAPVSSFTAFLNESKKDTL